ncbi:MAG: septum formation initiator family protein [Alphaproteobacteria bacterium]|nr:septum formation initiator family protein [Alphaproteobacteria bacterium]
MARQPFPRRIAFPLVTLGLAAYFGYYLVYGSHGLISLARVHHEIELKQAELDRIHTQREALEHRVSLLRPESVDPDMLEEQARARLGLTEPDEVVILMGHH